MLSQLCVKLRECCQVADVQGAQMLAGQIRQAYNLLRAKLDLFMQLEARRKQAMAGQ
jgi:histidine-containing phosphotransfer protein